MSALRDGRFRRLLGAEAVSSFGDSALFLSLGIWAKDLTGSNSAAGIAFAALAAPSACSPLFGQLVDRLRRLPVLLVTNVLTALALLPLLAVHSRHQVWILYAVALAYGVSFRVQSPAMAGLLKDMLPSAEAVGARAAIMTVTEGLRVLSPAVGAGLYAGLGGPALVLFDVATFAVAVALLLTLRVAESEPDGEDREPFLREVTGGFRHVRATPLLRQLVTVLSVSVAAAGLCDSAIFAAMDRLGRSASFVGVVLSAQGAGSVLGGVVATRVVRRLGAARGTGVGLAVVTAGLALTVVPWLSVFMAGTLLAGVAIPIMFVALGGAQQLYTPARLQGRVNSVINLFVSTPQTICISLGAGLVAVVDYRLMMATVAVVSAVCMAVLLLRPAPTPEVVPSVADTGAAAAAEATEPVIV